MDKATVPRLLDDLDRRDRRRKVFGANGHDYKLRPPLPAPVIQAFETQHGVMIPEGYRYFVTEVGNGGAGPYYGVFPFGQQAGGWDDCTWEAGGLVGDFSLPFSHVTAWNLPKSFWEKEPDPPPGLFLDEEDVLWEAWEEESATHYWNPAIINGAIPICHQGCALRQWLVIDGEQNGLVWNDNRADYRGISPLHSKPGKPMTFTEWYMTWLDNSSDQC